jgi:Zn-finger nucleic acid-binding protein
MSLRTFPQHQASLLECNVCAGVWVARKTFDHLCRSSFKSSFKDLAPRSNTKMQPPDRFYRICPVCNEVLNRLIFKKHSGIIIDVCNADGIWFDIHELEAALKFSSEVSQNPALRLEQGAAAVEIITPLPQMEKTEGDDSVYVIEDDIDLDGLMKTFFSR